MDCKTTFSIGAGVFTDEDFERAAKEVLDPDINGWEFFVESRGTKIYRNYKEVGPGNVYKSTWTQKAKAVPITLLWSGRL